MKIKMKSKKMRGVMSAAVLLLALTLPPAAHGQSDGFFSNAGGMRGGNGGVNGGGATLLGFEEDAAGLLGFEEDAAGGATLQGFDNGDVPLGGGLLVLALSGVCYAGAKRKKGER